jgi:hypothetical protein
MKYPRAVPIQKVNSACPWNTWRACFVSTLAMVWSCSITNCYRLFLPLQYNIALVISLLCSCTSSSNQDTWSPVGFDSDLKCSDYLGIFLTNPYDETHRPRIVCEDYGRRLLIDYLCNPFKAIINQNWVACLFGWYGSGASAYYYDVNSRRPDIYDVKRFHGLPYSCSEMLRYLEGQIILSDKYPDIEFHVLNYKEAIELYNLCAPYDKDPKLEERMHLSYLCVAVRAR